MQKLSGHPNKNTAQEKIETNATKKEITVQNADIKLWHYLIVGFIALLLYGNTVNNGYILDDAVYITHNVLVKDGFAGGVHDIITKGSTYGFNGLNEGAYRPLTLFTFAADRHFFGNDAGKSHLINTLLFALLSISILWFLLVMFPEMHGMVMLAITLLFVSHPIHTEVVANIKSRDEILGFLFGLGALIAAIHFLKKRKFSLLILASILYFFALLSKENLVTLALVAPLIIWYKTDPSNKAKALSCLLVFILPLAAYTILRFAFLDSFTHSDTMLVINNSLAGADDIGKRLATNIMIHGKYLWLLVFPYPLSFDYSFSQIPTTSFTNPFVLVSMVAFAGIGVYLFKQLRSKSATVFGILFYFLTLSVVSNLFFLTGSTMAERFLFIPSLGFSMVSGLIIFKAFGVGVSRSSNPYKSKYPIAIILSLIIVYGYMTMSRNSVWKDEYTLYTTDIKASPNSARVNKSAGNAMLIKAGSMQDSPSKMALLDESIFYLEKAVSIYQPYNDAWHNLGLALALRGKKEASVSALRMLVKLDNSHTDGWLNLGKLYLDNQQFDTAAVCFERAANSDPSKRIEYLYYIAESWQQKGDFSKAEKAYHEIAANKPHDEGPYLLIAKMYTDREMVKEAIAPFEKVLIINPANPDGYFNLGIIYKKLGDAAKSEQYLRKAYELDPSYFE